MAVATRRLNLSRHHRSLNPLPSLSFADRFTAVRLNALREEETFACKKMEEVCLAIAMRPSQGFETHHDADKLGRVPLYRETDTTSTRVVKRSARNRLGRWKSMEGGFLVGLIPGKLVNSLERWDLVGEDSRTRAISLVAGH